MLEEDPAEITVHLVQFEKDISFCMPGAEGTNPFVVTWLRRGGRTIVGAPFGRGGVVCVHHGWKCALRVYSLNSFTEVFRFLLAQEWARLPSCVLKPGAGVGGDPEGGRRQTPPSLGRSQSDDHDLLVV